MNPVVHHLLIDNERKGPFTIGQLRNMWASGAITSETLHHMDGYSEWLPLDYIREDLEPELQQAPPQTKHATYLAVTAKAKDHPNYGLYTAICVLIPIVGLLLGIIGMTKAEPLEKKLGEHALALSVVLMVVYYILGQIWFAAHYRI